MYTKIAAAPHILQLNGNQTIILATLLVGGLCIAMLLDYTVEIGTSGLMMSPAKSELLVDKC